MEYNISVIKGDGIGPEIITEALRVLDAVAQKSGHTFRQQELLMGGAAIDAVGRALPPETLQSCKESDAVLLGAVGGPKWDALPAPERPEPAILALRAGLELFANVRPARMHETLRDACPLKDDIVGDGLDLVIVRERTGGIYFGEKGRRAFRDMTAAYDVMQYDTGEIDRVVRFAFDLAMRRGKRLCSVDKANVLETSRLWRERVHEVHKDYPEVALTDMYVDNAAMQLVRSPGQFDVMVMGNLFGDILSDQASMLTGSIGMLPSASLGTGALGLYEPIHGSAPDIAGQNKANPIAAILSVAMLLRHSLRLEEEASAVERAVTKVLEEGYRCADIMTPGRTLLGTREMGAKITEKVLSL